MCPDFSLLKINNTVQMFNISVNFKDKKKEDHILESSLNFQFFSSACPLSIIGNQRRYLIRLLIPMFIGTPCTILWGEGGSCVIQKDFGFKKQNGNLF